MFLLSKTRGRGVTAFDDCLFVKVVIWVSQNGGKWYTLPPGYGKWTGVFFSAFTGGQGVVFGKKISTRWG